MTLDDWEFQFLSFTTGIRVSSLRASYSWILYEAPNWKMVNMTKELLMTLVVARALYDTKKEER